MSVVGFREQDVHSDCGGLPLALPPNERTSRRVLCCINMYTINVVDVVRRGTSMITEVGTRCNEPAWRGPVSAGLANSCGNIDELLKR